MTTSVACLVYNSSVLYFLSFGARCRFQYAKPNPAVKAELVCRITDCKDLLNRYALVADEKCRC